VAQKWRMARYRPRNKPVALDEERLRELALAYVGRFATTRARLIRYLERKLRERGWDGENSADLDALAERFAELGYIDDAGYARMKGAAMERRGLGVRRIMQALHADGVAETDRSEAERQAKHGKWDAADILARKKRIGPYAREDDGRDDPKQREKQIAAFLRAGHDFAVARAWVDAAPGEFPERSE